MIPVSLASRQFYFLCHIPRLCDCGRFGLVSRNEGARPRTTSPHTVTDTVTNDHERPPTNDQVFRALSEAGHVVPPCERLNTAHADLNLFIVRIYGASYRCAYCRMFRICCTSLICVDKLNVIRTRRS